MANLNKQIPIVVIYKKTKRGKAYMEVFTHLRLDDVIDANKRKPPLPHKYEILEIGVGEAFIEKYKQKYKLK